MADNNTINTVIVDVGGVLHESDREFIDDLRGELKLSDQDFDLVLEIVFEELGRGTISEDDFWARLHKEFGTRPISASEKMLSRSLSKNLILHQDFFKYIHNLKERGLQIVIFSNTIKPHVDVLRAAGIYKGFDREFLSNEIGHRKPEPDAFKYVLSALKIHPSEAIFIDDDLKNVTTAEMLGIKAVHFHDEAAAVHDIEKYLPRTLI